MPDRKLMFPPEYLGGLYLTRNSGTSITVGPGACFIPGLSTVVETLTSITVSGLSLTPSTTYYIYFTAVAGTPTVTVETVAPVAPYRSNARTRTGDSSKRLLGSFTTDGTGAVPSFPETAPEVATREEVEAKADNTKMVTPYGLTNFGSKFASLLKAGI